MNSRFYPVRVLLQAHPSPAALANSSVLVGPGNVISHSTKENSAAKHASQGRVLENRHEHPSDESLAIVQPPTLYQHGSLQAFPRHACIAE